MAADAGKDDSAAAEAALLQQRLMALPSVDEVVRRPEVAAWVPQAGRLLVVRAVREAIAGARAQVRAGKEVQLTHDDVARSLALLSTPSLRPVINATGVVLHTNLGRAPLARRALEAAVEIGTGYSNLEFDLDGGGRGSRYIHASTLLAEMLGVEDALVVNNCAAAVLLSLTALCQGRRAIVSRGELVEIGGGFRIPDVISQGGAQLHEVGTTNRTRLADYEAALTADTGALLKVHQSNFAVVGFTESVSVKELAGLGRARSVPVIVDLGTGRLADVGEVGRDEPGVMDVLEEGADLVTFSGDKLLGGPQAGVLAGKRELVARCRAHPLCRALRVDKLTLAAFEATLRLYRDGRDDEIPALRMLRQDTLPLRERAEKLCALLGGPSPSISVCEVTARPGGGTLPLGEMKSIALRIVSDDMGADALAAQLRAGPLPVVGRIEDAALMLDLRTVSLEEDAALAEVLKAVLARRGNDGARGGVAC